MTQESLRMFGESPFEQNSQVSEDRYPPPDHWYPVSIVQVEEHPSLLCVFPSSHSSLLCLSPSPQLAVQVALLKSGEVPIFQKTQVSGIVFDPPVQAY